MTCAGFSELTRSRDALRTALKREFADVQAALGLEPGSNADAMGGSATTTRGRSAGAWTVLSPA